MIRRMELQPDPLFRDFKEKRRNWSSNESFGVYKDVAPILQLLNDLPQLSVVCTLPRWTLTNKQKSIFFDESHHTTIDNSSIYHASELPSKGWIEDCLRKTDHSDGIVYITYQPIEFDVNYFLLYYCLDSLSEHENLGWVTINHGNICYKGNGMGYIPRNDSSGFSSGDPYYGEWKDSCSIRIYSVYRGIDL